MQQGFEQFLSIVIVSCSPGAWNTVFAASWKTIKDPYERILGDNRLAVKKNTVFSHIIEVLGERETLLDDVMLAGDEYKEQRRNERDERTELDNRLLEAVRPIRENAMGTSKLVDLDWHSNHGNTERRANDANTPRTKKKRHRAPVVVDSDEDQNNLISQHIEARREAECKSLKLKEERFDFEQRKKDREV
ncbi:unnamed protein product [Agarophyton chilense]|eukprot:gb/GEZJ01002932.1/.p2 GENE.gb/GEZJ01002932.1/~~gb/GEZJ01002932.1/.p2  ORF type:complete len:191 (+),score=30.53 gb/GEZJ01002932.1/:554-1126(+)